MQIPVRQQRPMLFPGVQYGVVQCVIIYRTFRKDLRDLRNAFEIRVASM